jgi:hypothetical protein
MRSMSLTTRADFVWMQIGKPFASNTSRQLRVSFSLRSTGW